PTPHGGSSPRPSRSSTTTNANACATSGVRKAARTSPTSRTSRSGFANRKEQNNEHRYPDRRVLLRLQPYATAATAASATFRRRQVHTPWPRVRATVQRGGGPRLQHADAARVRHSRSSEGRTRRMVPSH